MMSVSTQTQMLPQRCKVARGNNNGRTNPQTCMCFHICCYLLLYNHPLAHPYRHTYTHTVHAQKDISFTHTLSGSSFLVPPPRIQGPCLSTLVIMVNSWACYLIAAYGRLVALLGYIKTWLHVQTCSDDLCGVIRSFDSGPRPVYWVKSHRTKNAVQFLSNTQWIIDNFLLKGNRHQLKQRNESLYLRQHLSCSL